jgi:hypothetical protein
VKLFSFESKELYVSRTVSQFRINTYLDGVIGCFALAENNISSLRSNGNVKLLKSTSWAKSNHTLLTLAYDPISLCVRILWNIFPKLK